MKFCINIESYVNETNMRLQKDGSWAHCPNPFILGPNDYTTTDRDWVIAFQVFDREVMIDGVRCTSFFLIRKMTWMKTAGFFMCSLDSEIAFLKILPNNN